MKALFFDTSAIVKFFIPEEGSEVVRWLCSGENTLQFDLWRTASPRVRKEFFQVINRKFSEGEISESRAKQIKTTASNMFKQKFHIRGDQPSLSLPGEDVTVEDLLKRHKLQQGKHDWDMEHLVSIVNYLRFLGGESKVQVVTSDTNFAKVLRCEGYTVINPQEETIDSLTSLWSRTA